MFVAPVDFTRISTDQEKYTKPLVVLMQNTQALGCIKSRGVYNYKI